MRNRCRTTVVAVRPAGMLTSVIRPDGECLTVSEPCEMLQFPPPRRWSVAGLVVRWVTLLSFTAGSVGVPVDALGLWGSSATCAKRPGEPCRCSAVSRSLGVCCCARGARETACLTAAGRSERCSSPDKSGECKTPLAGARGCKACPPRPKSCCAQKKTPAAEPPARTSSLAMSSCPCGGASPAALLLVCGEPRVRPAVPELTALAPTVSVLERFNSSPRGLRPRPAVPPPKSLPA